MTGSSYGKLNELGIVPTSTIFVAILILLSLLKLIFLKLDEAFAAVGCTFIIKALKEELMYLGVYSYLLRQCAWIYESIQYSKSIVNSCFYFTAASLCQPHYFLTTHQN
jgi:hypothetical protein